MHDFKTSVWGSPVWLDGRIYIGTSDGDVVVFQHGRAERILARIEMDDPIHATPIACGGVLYVASRSTLYSISAHGRGR